MSGVTGASITPEKHIPRKKRNMKSLTISPPRKDPIPNQDINMIRTVKDQNIPPQLLKFCLGYKSLINEADDDCHDSTDISCTDNKYSAYNLKATNNKNIDDEYKGENSQHQHSNESVINKNK